MVLQENPWVTILWNATMCCKLRYLIHEKYLSVNYIAYSLYPIKIAILQFEFCPR
jgi:hypothetical protein